MSTALRFVRLRRLAWVGVVFLVVAIPDPPTAAAAWRAPPVSAPAGDAPLALTAPISPAPALFADDSGWSWRSLLKPLEFLQGSRRNMIQAATIAMCIALYIIWWRRAVEN
jgi:hypothetical protein